MTSAGLAEKYAVWEMDPIMIHFTKDFGVRYYGVAYMMGFLAGFGLLWLASKRGKSPLTVGQNADFLFALILGVVIGGRLGYFLLYGWEAFVHNPLVLFRVWEGGMASHGGFIGVLLAMMWFARSRKVPFWKLADLTCMITPPGLFFGRIANFINGELWGKESDVSWAIIFPNSAPVGTPVGQVMPRHPSQLYEAGLEGIVLFTFVAFRFWRGKTRELAPGQIAGEFLVAYAILRIIGEIFRQPDADPIMGLSRGTFYSILTAIAGVLILIGARQRASRQVAT